MKKPTSDMKLFMEEEDVEDELPGAHGPHGPHGDILCMGLLASQSAKVACLDLGLAATESDWQAGSKMRARHACSNNGL